MATTRINTQQAIADINALIDKFESLRKSTLIIGSSSRDAFKTLEQSLKSLKDTATQTDAAFQVLDYALQQGIITQKNYNQQIKDLTAQQKITTAEIKKQTSEYNKLNKEVSNGGGLFGKLTSSVSSLLKAFGIVSGIQLFVSILKNAYDLTKQFDSISFTLKKVTKDAFDYGSSQRFLTDITQAFGVELIVTAERWSRFLAASKQAGVSLRDTEQIFRSVTKASAALGLNTEDLNSVYLALEQMMSKGKITTEELRRQLGERMPGAVGIMAAAIGVNVAQLDKMLKKGELLSADVLPKFAKALELAYGIDNVESIDNIQAAQTRLTNAWQEFIYAITEGRPAVKNILNFLAEKLGEVAEFFMNNEQKLQAETLTNQKAFNDKLLNDARYHYDKMIGEAQRYRTLKDAIEEAKTNIQNGKNKGLSGDDQAALQQVLADNIKAMTDYNEKVDAIEVDWARKHIEGVNERYESDKKVYDAEIAKLDALMKKRKETFFMNNDVIRDQQALVDGARKHLAYSQGVLDVYRKLVEVSKAVSPINKDDKTKKPGNYYIPPTDNLENEVREANLKSQLKYNEEELKQEGVKWEKKKQIIEENVAIELQLADAARNEDIEKTEKYVSKELAALQKAKDKKEIIHGDEIKKRQELEDYCNEGMLLANNKFNNAMEDAYHKRFDAILNLMKSQTKEEEAISDDNFNKQIMMAKAEYEASSKNYKDKAKLEHDLTNIAEREFNARIEIQIKWLEVLKATNGTTAREVQDIDRQINALRASLKNIFPDKAHSKEALTEWLSEIKKYVDAGKDLGDAIYDRKIENINAEIDAEKNKYDTLINLAKNNQEEQDKLAEQRDKKVAILEAKRLKEQQRKARFDKATALMQIALNTAIAITKLPADGGILGMLAIPSIIALGALEAAAVVAAPIPKYKDGLKEAQTDHIAMINDGVEKEYIERDGKILSTDTKDAIVELKKGDTVHKSFNDMVDSSELFNTIHKAAIMTSLSNSTGNIDTRKLEDIFDNNLRTLGKDLRTSIKDGFRNVTINNKVVYDAAWIAYKNDTL